MVTQPLLNGNSQDNFLQAVKELQELTVGIIYPPALPGSAHCHAGTPRLLSQCLNVQSWYQGWMDQTHIKAENHSPPDQPAVPKQHHLSSKLYLFYLPLSECTLLSQATEIPILWSSGEEPGVTPHPSGSCGFGNQCEEPGDPKEESRVCSQLWTHSSIT